MDDLRRRRKPKQIPTPALPDSSSDEESDAEDTPVTSVPERTPSAAPQTSKGDDDDYMLLDFRNKKAGCFRRAVGLVYSFILIHYLFWGVIMGIFLYFLARSGPIGLVVSVVLVLLYIPSFLNSDQYKTGRPWDGFRMFGLWKLTQEYLDLRLIRTKKLDPSRNYIFGFHPHGIIILSRVATYGGAWEKLFPGIEQRTLGASPMFYLPGVRELSLWMGAVDASKSTAQRILREKFSLLVYPGGSKEIFPTRPDSKKTVLVLKERRGFIKLAMQFGTPLVPVFVFGEKWRYSRFVFPEAWRKWCLNVLRIPLLVFFGRFGTLMPQLHKNGMGVVFGTPIEVEKNENPSDADIAKIQEVYEKAVRALYVDHHKEMGYDDDEVLEIN